MNNKVSANTIAVRVVGSDGELYWDKADMVIASAYNGEVGIKPKHAPFLAMLKPGQITIITGEHEEGFYVSGGVIEVQPYLVTILADNAERAKDIDESKALRAKEDAEKLLADKSAKLDYAKLQVQLAQSLAQLRAAKRFKNRAEHKRS